MVSLVLCISVRDLTITTARKLNLLASPTVHSTHSGNIRNINNTHKAR